MRLYKTQYDWSIDMEQYILLTSLLLPRGHGNNKTRLIISQIQT